MLNDIKTSSNKILVCITAAVMLLFIALSGIIFSNEVYAEENSERETGVDSSAFYNIIANNREIGTARLSMSACMKESGEAMFLVQAQIAPKVNDGSNDYKVIGFCLDVNYGSHYDTLTDIEYKDNREVPVITTTNSLNTIVSSDGITFQVGSNYTLAANKGSVMSNIVSYENIPGEDAIMKRIYVEVNQPTKDTVINYQIAFFFKVEPTDFTLFTAELYDLQVDGVFLAPDYGVNNSENIFLVGASNIDKEFLVEDMSGIRLDDNNMPEKDGSANDTLDKESFDQHTYVR